jgi:hypothetical protein
MLEPLQEAVAVEQVLLALTVLLVQQVLVVLGRQAQLAARL